LACHIAAWKFYNLPHEAAGGLSHTLGKAVGAKNGIAHGITSCVLLPQVLRYSCPLPAARPAVDRLSAALGLEPASPAHVPLAEALEDLVARLRLPSRFTRSEIDEQAEREAATRTAEQMGLPVETVMAVLAAGIAE